MTRLNPGEYLTAIASETSRFVEALDGVDPSARVPSCPEWSAADLLWHLAEVQLFWTAIVRDRLDDQEQAEAMTPDRPADWAGLNVLVRDANAQLSAALAGTPDDVAVWTWASDQSVGFVRRHQAFEALVHRIDAELVADRRTPLPAALSADGVDEALTYAYAWRPGWSEVAEDGARGILEAVDTSDRWSVQLAHWSGHSPDTGKDYPGELTVISRALEPAAGHGDADFKVTAAAGDLLAWIYGRPSVVAPVTSGDQAGLADFEKIRRTASQ